MFSAGFTMLHWEKVRDYLAMSFFHDITPPSTSTESEEEFVSLSSGDFPPRLPIILPRISPLPELIIEKNTHENRGYETEEFYDKLEAKITKFLEKSQRFLESRKNYRFKDMDTSQEIDTDEEQCDTSPDGIMRNVPYTVVNSFSSEVDINGQNSGEQAIKQTNNITKERNEETNTIINESFQDYSLEVNTNENCQNTSLYQNTNSKSSTELQYKLVSVQTIVDVHTVPAINTNYVLQTDINVNYLSKSPILGLTVHKKADNDYECLNLSDSSSNHEPEEVAQECASESEDTSNDDEYGREIDLLETIPEERLSQINDTNGCNNDAFKGVMDVTVDPESTDLKTSNEPETMRAAKRNSIRETQFSFNHRETFGEINIVESPTSIDKKFLEIKEHKDAENSFSSPEEASVTNPNVNFRTSTPKSGIHKNIVESPILITKSQQCEQECTKRTARKREAGETVNNEILISSGIDVSNWESLSSRIFVGLPKIYRLCKCKAHVCN